MAYNIGEWYRARKDFQTSFGVSIAPFYDGLMTVLCNRIMIDIVKFDGYISEKYPEDESLSCNEIISKHYGDEAANLIDELI